jgi:hypothetical protein
MRLPGAENEETAQTPATRREPIRTPRRMPRDTMISLEWVERVPG